MRFCLAWLSLPLAASLAGPTYAAQCSSQTRKWLANDGAADDGFGNAIAVDGGLALVGATGDVTASGLETGSAYLFDLTTGAQLHKLVASDGTSFDFFGFSVAVSPTRALVGAVIDDVGANASGSVYVFDSVNGTETMKLTASDAASGDRFGFAVALSGDRALVGAPYDDGDETDSGSVYVIDLPTGAEVDRWRANVDGLHDYFGWSIAADGNLAAIGTPGDNELGFRSGAVHLFDLQTGDLLRTVRASDGTTNDQFGSSLAIAEGVLVVGAPQVLGNPSRPGAAYAFDPETGIELWKASPADGQPADLFGAAVALAEGTAFVGSLGDDDLGDRSGSVFQYDAQTGIASGKLLADDGRAGDFFGTVAASDGTLVVGAYLDDDRGDDSGSAYVFDLASPGSTYCAATPNSTGESARAYACGSSSLSDNDLTLGAVAVPDSFYLFFRGTTQVQVPFGDGFRCVGGAVRRLQPPRPAMGHRATRTLDLPSAGITAPGTMNFQCWFRDSSPGGAGFNLSDAVSVDFVP